MDSRLYCFVCRKKPKNESIVQLTEDKFQKCLEILEIKKKHQLVYSDVVLPSQLSELVGYHSGCYKRFTALSQKYKKSAKLSAEKNAEPSASTSTDAPTTDSFASNE